MLSYIISCEYWHIYKNNNKNINLKNYAVYVLNTEEPN